MDIFHFVSVCRCIAEVLGQDGYGLTGGMDQGPAKVYRDDVVEIVAAKDGGIGVTNLSNHNPTIIFKKEMEYVRSHGEWVYAKEHVGKLLAQIAESVNGKVP